MGVELGDFTDKFSDTFVRVLLVIFRRLVLKYLLLLRLICAEAYFKYNLIDPKSYDIKCKNCYSSFSKFI